MILVYTGGEGRAAVGLTGSLDQFFVELVGHDGFREIPAITRKKTEVWQGSTTRSTLISELGRQQHHFPVAPPSS